MRFYTTQILSANQELTPEGYLLCKDVPIARTGTMLYASGEVPVTSKNGIISIDRLPEEVFRDETIRSFQGKPITINHPAMDVDTSNWSQLAKGTLQNVRQGDGINNDFLYADLLITDAAAIRQVRDGLREVSCGYDADYEEIQPGQGKQTNIFGNHLALVEKGRCGSRCAIGDSMKKIKWMDRLRAAFVSRDETAFETTLKDEPTKDEADETDEEKKKRLAKEAKEADDAKTSDAAKTTDALLKLANTLDGINTRLAALETRDADEEETPEEKKKREEKEAKEAAATGDSASLATLTQEVIARAEILSPGLTMPTFDAAATPAKTNDSLCALRRKALENAYANPKTRDAVAPLVAGVNLATMTCDALHSTFVGASEIVRRDNNAQSASATFDGAKVANGMAKTISEINRRNADFWKRS